MIILLKPLTSLLLLIAIFTLTSKPVLAKSNDDTLTVEYRLAGKIHTIVGEKTEQGYRFNKNANKVVYFTTSSWPPYISEGNCNKGWVFKLAAALLVSKGYQVNILFYPWARANMLAEQGLVDGVFPLYNINQETISEIVTATRRLDLLALSDAFPGGTLSLITSKDNTQLSANDLAILHNKIIGVVRGYTHTPEIDKMIENHYFSVVEAVDELQLVKLLVAKRVDFIIGDRTVFNHSVTISNLSDKEKRDLIQALKLVEPALAQHPLFFALSTKRSNWQQLQTDINDALKTFNNSGETQRFIDMNAKFRCYQPQEEHTPL